MGKIVGRKIIYLLLLAVILLDARVTMEIRTETAIHNQVVVGQPFTIDVVIDDVYGSVQAPTIKGLDGFNAQRTGMYMSSINGKSTTRYSYQVRINTIGSYTLGPAVVVHQQQEFTSNVVQLDVVKDVTVQKNKNSQTTALKAFLRLMLDEESVVVGQKMGCTLRFYYQDSSISLQNIGVPELAGFDVKEIGKPEMGTAEIDGVQYRYAQWQWDMYPTKPGEFVIPAYNADYEIPSKDNHMLGGFFMFVNNRAERKRVYSNALTIKVAPLPHYDGDVHAVGSFERITAEIKPGVAKEGEGMVLAIEIEGVGNLHAIAAPLLIMPTTLKYYDSNNAIIEPQQSDKLPKKKFEYIVQGMHAGHCEIPEQLFTYFDIERSSYVTLRTTPLAVSIMPGLHGQKKESITTPSNSAVELSSAEPVKDTIAHINSNGQWYPVTALPCLPWWLFHLLFFMPFLYVSYPAVSRKYVVLSNRFLSWKRACRRARKKLDQSKQRGDVRNIYVIFSELFLLRGQYASDAELLQDSERMMRANGLSDQFIAEWRNFFERITHGAYAQLDDMNVDELWRMAYQWIERLEKLV